jgi:endonuclease/exonuclease/phosphatase family metal-dependent hydrolase
LVETWHDDAHSPDLIACVPPGFTLIERSRPRNDDFSLLTNHGGVCLLCDASLHAREIPLPVFSSFEVVGAYIHRSGLSAVLVVVYRTDNVTQAFYDQVSNLLEKLATFSASTIVVGDFNIHVDDPMDADANKFADIFSCDGLRQHVTSPTDRLGHMLDLFITRPELSVYMLPVDPPLLSDHSFLVAEVVCPQYPVVDMPSCSRLTR